MPHSHCLTAEVLPAKRKEVALPSKGGVAVELVREEMAARPSREAI